MSFSHYNQSVWRPGSCYHVIPKPQLHVQRLAKVRQSRINKHNYYSVVILTNNVTDKKYAYVQATKHQC